MNPVIVGVDNSESARAALRWACDFANRTRTSVVAVMVLALPDLVGRAASAYDELRQRDETKRGALAHLTAFVHDAVGDAATFVELRVVEGDPVRVLADESRSASMVVVGARGAGEVKRLLLGSVSTGVAHHAHCPVVVVRGVSQAAEPAATTSQRA